MIRAGGTGTDAPLARNFVGRWSQTDIAGKPADVFEPSRPLDPARGLLTLHGHDLRTLADDPAFTPLLEERGLFAICPHGGQCWWGSRICNEFDVEIDPLSFLHQRLLPEVTERWGVAPPLLAAFGIEMGGQGALRLAYRWPREFAVVAAISPAVDFQNWHGRGTALDDMYPSRESARQETATLELHPLNWPRHQLIVCDPLDPEWFEGTERLISKLSSIGIPYDDDLRTSAQGNLKAYTQQIAPRVMDFLAERLERETLRA
jgi:S-formylglutathione hydrolase